MIPMFQEIPRDNKIAASGALISIEFPVLAKWPSVESLCNVLQIWHPNANATRDPQSVVPQFGVEDHGRNN